jgi:hypothetical protein
VEQFGFTAGLSTTHQLYRIVCNVKNNLSEGRSTGMVFFDSEKAFVSVWHGGLIFKLQNRGYPRYLQCLIYSYLTDRSFQVFINDISSDPIGVPAGVPQGSVLSPNLYNIFTHDAPAHGSTESALYADDTAIFSSGVDPTIVIRCLQEHSNALLEYFASWKIKINSSKTEAIFFSRRRASRYLPGSQISVNGINIPWAQKVKYLGLTMDKKLIFKDHCEQLTSKISKLIKVYYPFINRRSRLNKCVKLTLYKTIFRPSLLYASPAWSGCATSHKKKLQVLQNKILKMILNKPWYYSTDDLHEEAGVSRLTEHITLSDRAFVGSLRFVQNPLVSNLAA